MCLSVALALTACQSHMVSDSEQQLARLQQERARLNRVYAHAEISILEQQKTDQAYQAARFHFQALRQLRFKACTPPTSNSTSLRLSWVQCQYDILLKDYQQLFHWQQSQYQFPPKVSVPQN